MHSSHIGEFLFQFYIVLVNIMEAPDLYIVLVHIIEVPDL